MKACVSTRLSLSAERRSQRLENPQRSIQNTVCNGGGFGFLLGLADYRGKYSDVGRDSVIMVSTALLSLGWWLLSLAAKNRAPRKLTASVEKVTKRRRKHSS